MTILQRLRTWVREHIIGKTFSHHDRAPGDSAVSAASLAERAAATQSASFYDQSYYERPKAIAQESGYAGYSPHEPAVVAAIHIVTTYFQPRRVLDVGCAKGYVVDGLRRRRIDAWGIDFSPYAIAAAPAAVRHYVSVGDAADIHFPDNSFDLVICLETLEHLTVERAIQAAAELYRVTADKLWLTIPSMGVNDFGPPDGWPQSKIREEALWRYLDSHACPDPAELDDLMLDPQGYPIHGHLIAASYRWWTELFTRQGFMRCGQIERRLNQQESLLRQGLWNSYVFVKPPISGASLTAQEAAIERILAARLTSEVGTPMPAAMDDAVVYQAEAGAVPGLLVRGPRLPLPPGRYTATFHLDTPGADTIVNPWTELAVLDIRSAQGEKIHALRTLRARDLSDGTSHEIQLTFVSGGEPDFEFRIWFSGPCTLRAPDRLPQLVRA